MAEKKKLSVQEILAAARKQDAARKEGGGEPAPAPQVDSPPAEEAKQEAAPQQPVAPKPPPEKPAAKPSVEKPTPKPAAAGGRPSVADMIAAARAAKGAGPASAPAAPSSSETPAAPEPAAEKPKPAPKPAVAKSAAAEAKPAAATAAPAGGRTTASILDAAREGKKLGPMSKSAAAAIASPPMETKPGEARPAKAKPVVPPMPTKPAYAKKPEVKAPATEDRRGFLAMLSLAVGSFLAAGFTAMTGTFGLWTLGFARFMFPNILTEPPSRFKIGLPAEYPAGKVDERFKGEFGVWVVHAEYNGQPQIFALSTVCTHLGCTPNWLEAEQKFKCPCHGSGFYKDGINFEGPAPRPLERFAIRLADDGQLEVDKSRLFQEEKGEWSSPDCFVPV